MDYLKINSYDLAAQSAELNGVYNRISRLSDDVANIVSALDVQIKSRADIQKGLASAQTGLSDIAARLLSMHGALDAAADIYHAAENKALREAENLPAGSFPGDSAGKPAAAPAASVSSISNSDIIIEDWLAELIYKSAM